MSRLYHREFHVLCIVVELVKHQIVIILTHNITRRSASVAHKDHVFD